MAKEVVDRYTQLGKLRFHYRDWGGDGPPAVLLHGLASNSRIWDLVAPILTRRFSVVALDQRSHGETEGTNDGYDFTTVAGDLRLFLDALGLERSILVGHSWGGNVVLELAATRPDTAAGLVFVDGGINNLRSKDGVTWEEVASHLAPPDLTSFTLDGLVARAREGHWQGMWRPEVESVLRAGFTIAADGTVRPRLSRERHMKLVRALWDQSSSDLFSKVMAPVLILPARRDGEERPVNSPSKEEMVARAEALLACARTVWLEDSIHDVPLQRPDKVAGAILQTAEEGFFGT